MPSKYGFGDTRKKSAPTYKKAKGPFKMKGSPYKVAPIVAAIIGQVVGAAAKSGSKPAPDVEDETGDLDKLKFGK